MSLFQPKSKDNKKENDDVLHLNHHGCDVVFSHCEKGTRTTSSVNISLTKNKLVEGTIILCIDGEETRYTQDDWFEIPANKEHSIEYRTDCSIIEFWFHNKAE